MSCTNTLFLSTVKRKFQRGEGRLLFSYGGLHGYSTTTLSRAPLRGRRVLFDTDALRTGNNNNLLDTAVRWYSSSAPGRIPHFFLLTPLRQPQSLLGGGGVRPFHSATPPPLSWLSSLAWWLTDDQKKKLPRGFQDFFPENAKRQAPDGAVKPGTTSSGSSTEASSSTGAANDGKLASESKPSSGGSGNNNKKQQPPPPPPPFGDDESANLPGLVALLALVVALWSWMEQQEEYDQQLGQEITFVDFRNQFLNTGQVEKLQVVNNRLARVILRQGTASLLEDASGGSVIADETSWENSQGGSSSIPATVRFNERGSKSSNGGYYFYIGSVDSFEERLTKAQAHIHPQHWIEVQYITKTNYALEFVKILPIVAFVAALYFGWRGIMNSTGLGGGGGSGSRGGGGGFGNIFSVGRSTARKITSEDVNVTFADVAGCQQAKLEVMEFVDFLKDSDHFTKLGAKIPKGALLCGPPGTGKTLLAKAVAGEAGVPFYSISGSDFIEMFVGVGPARVRDLFKEARQNSPCIVFIDEIDAVGRQRGRGGFSGGGNDERENTLNQLLVEMDGFSPTTGVVLLAGTNRVDILDQALTRPGRFDRQIVVDKPDLQGRKDIFKVHLQKITLGTDETGAILAATSEGEENSSSDETAPEVDEEQQKQRDLILEEFASRLAGLTPGFAGADIANLCNEAAIVAARRAAEYVDLSDFEKATDRIIGGLESNKIMSKHEKEIVAHHEAGHAVAGWFLEHADPLLKVTIIPRTSGALGFAQYLPKEVFLRTQEQILDLVCLALAGRAAEEVFFGRVTTGASDDLRRVTQLVYSMIRDFGMNPKLGQLAFSKSENQLDKPYSEDTAQAMDEEARSMVEQAYQRTVELIREHKSQVETVAQMLLEKETITHDDVYDVVGPRPYPGDALYQEFVSQRAARKAKQEREQEDGEKNQDGDGLTPGLASLGL